MKSSFVARRKARVVGHDEGEEDAGTSGGGGDTEPTVKRPSRPKHRSSSRLSFGPGGTSMGEDEASPGVFTPKKANISRQAIEKNALRKSALAASMTVDRTTDRHSEDRPSYSKDYLAELKSSTPSTPKALQDDSSKALDVASKFGTDLVSYELRDQNPSIPTEAEIQEKKARRARLAKEQRYRPEKDSGSDDEEKDVDERRDSDEDEFRGQHDRISLTASRSRHPETRLVRDDEDMMEDFDSFVDDGRINFSREAQREQRARQKTEMRELIDRAEASSGDDSDDSERERRDAYEAAQTRKGMEGLRVNGSDGDDRAERAARTPPRITPLPSLSSCVERLQARLSQLAASQAQKRRELEALARERRDIEEREVEIQRLLKETGERYERLRAEAGPAGQGEADGAAEGMGRGRGLESLGASPPGLGGPQ